MFENFKMAKRLSNTNSIEEIISLMIEVKNKNKRYTIFQSSTFKNWCLLRLKVFKYFEYDANLRIVSDYCSMDRLSLKILYYIARGDLKYTTDPRNIAEGAIRIYYEPDRRVFDETIIGTGEIYKLADSTTDFLSLVDKRDRVLIYQYILTKIQDKERKVLSEYKKEKLRQLEETFESES